MTPGIGSQSTLKATRADVGLIAPHAFKESAAIANGNSGVFVCGFTICV